MDGDYAPSPKAHVRDQIERYEASGGTEANTLAGTDVPIVVVTMRGARSGLVRKVALLRIEHHGTYALVASDRGRPQHPQWYANLQAHPDEVWIQDGPEPKRYRVRELSGDERATWWARACEVFADYDEYQSRTERLIPVILAEPSSAD